MDTYDVSVRLDLHQTVSPVFLWLSAMLLVAVGGFTTWRFFTDPYAPERPPRRYRTVTAMLGTVVIMLGLATAFLFVGAGNDTPDELKRAEAEAITEQTSLTVAEDSVDDLPAASPLHTRTIVVEDDEGVQRQCTVTTRVQLSNGQWSEVNPTGKLGPTKTGGVRMSLECDRR